MMNDISTLKNICTILNTAPFSSTISGVFTHVPPDTPYPYIALEWEGRQSALNKRSVTFKLHIFSDYQGTGPLIQLAEQVQQKFSRPHTISEEDHEYTLQMKRLTSTSTIETGGVSACVLRYQAFIKPL